MSYSKRRRVIAGRQHVSVPPAIGVMDFGDDGGQAAIGLFQDLPGRDVDQNASGCERLVRIGVGASAHAQRFEQLAKRDDVIEQVFNDPATAGTSPREKAIVLASIDLTLTPGQVEPAQLRALREVGLSDDEILDLIHSIAIFAWANRLMLNLGEPVG